MKIALITATYPPYAGGMGNSARDTARILSQENEVLVYTLDQENDKDVIDSCLPAGKASSLASHSLRRSGQAPRSDKIKVKRIKPLLSFGFKNGGFVPQLYRELNGFDCVYLHYPFFGGAEIIWLYALLHRTVRLVIHFHMDTPGLKGVGKFLSIPSQLTKHGLFKRADEVICTTFDYVRYSSIASYLRAWPDKFHEIPYGIDLNKFNVFPYDVPRLKELRERYEITPETRVVLLVGGLDSAHYFKGVDVLLRAAAKLKNKNYKFIIFGDGDLRPGFEAQAHSLGIGEQVIFTGRMDSDLLPFYYNIADVFVLPSIDSSEAFGIVFIEAMACGTPVIASNLPGVRSVFEKDKQGLLVQPRDEDDLAAKINEVLTNDLKRQAMGNAARELVEKKYDWRRVAEQLEKVILSL
ncbi:MAG: glycosyltransferase family 4 protein [bacterium]|nr:glycosyltransferase family 4 protein [bacterium]